MRDATSLLAAASALSLWVAACGPVATNDLHSAPPLPPLPDASASASTTPETPPPAPIVRPAGEKNTSVAASVMGRELAKIGIDPAKPPKLGAMTPEQKKAIMPLFARALGYERPGDPGCTGCHRAGDYRAETRQKAIARQMYDRFSVDFEVFLGSEWADARGAEPPLVFCDSCHASAPKTLDRGETTEVRAFMQAEYVGKLSRRDQKATDCATCHGEELELSIFDRVWKVPR